MNVIDYKINETKLQELTDKAYERGLIDPFFIMNNETIAMLEAHCCEHCHCERILYKYNDPETDIYYCGIEIIPDNELKFGEVQLCGYEDKMATIIKIYATGETEVLPSTKERIFVRID